MSSIHVYLFFVFSNNFLVQVMKWQKQRLSAKTSAANTLQHAATHCNTLQHTATHYTILHPAATHYNTPHHTTTQEATLNSPL